MAEKLQIVTDRIFLRFDYKRLINNFKSLLNAIGNILVFIPLGFLSHTLMKRWYGSSPTTIIFAFVSGTLFSFSIETLQYFSFTRYSSLIDLLNNMVGAALGIMIDKYHSYLTLMLEKIIQQRRNWPMQFS